MMNRSKSFFNSINDIKVWMSTKTSVPNHYETLKVAQNCTQDDIKSAYYELSKKYHPDRNASVDARKKFQNVSDAYEVLGNFSKRKLYDRDLMARGSSATQRPVYSTVDEDPLTGFYRSRRTNENTNTYSNTGQSMQYDFDEWTRAHYGRSLRRSLNDKQGKLRRAQLVKEMEEDIEKDKNAAIFTLSVAILIIMTYIIQNIRASNFDKNLIKKRKEEKNKKDEKS